MGQGNTTFPSWSNSQTSLPSWAGDVLKSVKGGSKTKQKSGGGFLGGLEKAAHVVANKTELAANDVKSIPGGLYDMGKTETQAISDDLHGRNKAINKREWNDLFHGHLVRMFQEAGKGDATPAAAHNAQIVGSILSSPVTVAKHPLRDPFQTVTTLLPFLGVAGRAADIASAGRISAADRLINVGDAKVPLQASKNPAVKLAQLGHDKIVQRALDKNPEGRLAKYGAKRVGGSIAETGRYQARLRGVPVQQLERAAKKLGRGRGAHGGNRLKQAALELTSANTAPEKASAYHLSQAEKGINPAQNRAVAELYRRVAEDKLLTTNKHGDVIVNAAKHPKLAVADARLAEAQGRGDAILKRYGVRSAEALAERVNAPGRIREGGTFKPETLADIANPETHVGKAVRAIIRTQTKAFDAPAKVEALDTRTGLASVRFFKRGGGSWTKEIPFEDVHTGNGKIAGGETARPGRGFLSYKTSEPKAGKGAVAGSPGPVIGEARSPITSKRFEGKGIEQGAVPNDVTGQAARHLSQILRFHNTSELRGLIAKTGSDARRTSRDVLIRVPGEDHAAIPAEIESLLGRKRLTTDDAAGIEAALQAYREDLVPGLRDKFAADRQTGIGTPAPTGYRWVDRQIVGDLARMPRGPRGSVARGADWLNSAVTAATVYFKIGHVGTRVLTNAATNIIQGSAAPLQLAKSRSLFGELSETDRLRALAAAGQHGFEAMPHEGTSKAASVAHVGAQWWAKHADAPFRFNSIAYEARRAGITTADGFRGLLNDLENPEHLTPEQFAKVDGIAKRANREQIAYDRLSESERRFIARGVWFYNWVKGTINFAGNTALEHPYKTGVLGAAGVQGRKNQAKELGALPSYEGGLFKIGGGKRPLVSDFSTFSPFSTPADVANAAARPAELSGQLNPALTAATNLIFGLNQYGGKSKSPIKDALASLVAPTPEAQILQAYLDRNKNQSGRMFEKTPYSAFLRALVGPAMPRRVNLAAAHKAAARERSGR